MNYNGGTRGDLYTDILIDMPQALSFEAKVALAVIDQAVRDFAGDDKTLAAEARVFILSGYFDDWCEGAGLSAVMLRVRLAARGLDGMV